MRLQIDFYVLISTSGFEPFGSVDGHLELPKVPKIRDIVDIFEGRRPPKDSFDFDGRLKVVTVSEADDSNGGSYFFIGLDAVLVGSREEADRLADFLENEIGFFVTKVGGEKR